MQAIFASSSTKLNREVLADDHEMRDIDGVSRDGNEKGFSRR